MNRKLLFIAWEINKNQEDDILISGGVFFTGMKLIFLVHRWFDDSSILPIKDDKFQTH